jgi:acyl-CoA thioesterase-2
MASGELEAWDSRDLDALLQLETIDPWTFVTRRASPNARGHVFGGQLLGNALMAAAMTVSPERQASALQFMFLQSASPDRPVRLELSPLQDGKRFVSRHVRGTQEGDTPAQRRVVLDAQATFALPLPGPEHAAPSRAGTADPESLPPLETLSKEYADAIWRTLGYPLDSTALDLRIADPGQGLGLNAPTPAIRFWLRSRAALPDAPALHAAAFAYLSDWWLNFASVGIHVPALDRGHERLHVASLNHAIWFHRPLRADRWLHFDVQSPRAAAGRGLSVATVHDLDGALVASATQENLMTPAS